MLKGTKIRVFDNSGAAIVKNIQICNHNKQRKAKIGELIQVSVKSIKKKKKVEKKGLYYLIITNISTKTKRIDGSTIKFDNSSGTIITKQYKFLATNLKTAVSKEFRKKKYKNFYKDILSITDAVI